MTIDIGSLRREYAASVLDESHVERDPLVQFQRWFSEAVSAEVAEPNGMTLATVGADGAPSARVVLLKAVDRGFVLYTNRNSQKGVELDACGRAALVFWWEPLERQVRIEGRVERVEDTVADEYFASRPRSSQLGAWASQQSCVVANRGALEDAMAAAEERFADGDVPRPPHWGGYRVVPERVEFWQGRRSRLHDRIRYRRQDDVWICERLAP